MPAKVYTEKDADLKTLKGKTLAVIGYGSQGHAHALNLKESGLKVIIGLYPKSKSVEVAKKQGFKVFDTAEAVRKADVIMLGVPDMKHAAIYENDVLPNLGKGKTLLFTHGLAIHYGLISPPKGVDVIMVAPKGPGHVVRSQYVEGKGVPALIAVHEGSSRNAKKVALAWAKGVGGTRAGVLQTTFREEVETDLFGEQAVLCGGVTELVLQGFETLTDAGYQPEVAYFECMHELKLIVDLLHEGGLAKMHEFISETAKYGDLTRGPRVVDDHTREKMREVLTDIQDGTFARQWTEEYESGMKEYEAMMNKDLEHPVEKVGRDLRARMSWLKARKQAAA